MSVRTEHFVIFYSPGTFVSESSSQKIDSWDTKTAVKMAKDITERHSSKPYGFRFETRIVADPISDGCGGFLKVESKTTKTSGMYFLGGELETYDRVKLRNKKDEEILRSNMRGNDWWVICVNTNSWKITQPFTEYDLLVDAAGKIVERGDSQFYTKYRADCKKKYAKDY